MFSSVINKCQRVQYLGKHTVKAQILVKTTYVDKAQ